MARGRRNLKAMFPCVHCRGKIEISIFEHPLESWKPKKAAGYWPSKDGKMTEATCGSCGTRQKISFQAVVEKI